MASLLSFHLLGIYLGKQVSHMRQSDNLTFRYFSPLINPIPRALTLHAQIHHPQLIPGR